MLAIRLTWTNAVAIKTPVPKCLQKKKIGGGIFIHLTFFATTGNPAPPIEAAKTMTVVVVRRQPLSFFGNTYRLQLRATESHSLQNLHHCHILASPWRAL
jgi:hypothetical protein